MATFTQNPSVELVTLSNGIPKTTSFIVSEIFGKQHKNVLRAIQNLDCSPEFSALNFELCLKNSDLQNGKPQPFYSITRDGFTFLAMGFTGKEAARFKEAYIAAFNAMESAVRNTPPPVLPFDTPTLDAPPFERVQPSLFAELRRMSKSLAQAYLIECGVTPDYVAGLLKKNTAALAPPALPTAQNVAPLDVLAVRLAELADEEDDRYWYRNRKTFEQACGDRDPDATARALAELRLLHYDKRDLMLTTPPRLACMQLRVFAVAKRLGALAAQGAGHA